MSPLNAEVLAHYDTRLEQGRLFRGAGELERARVQDLLTRTLPPAPATVLDVGGGAGAHALWLAARGYEVHLVDAMPLHVEQACAASRGAERPLASVALGDARELPWPDQHADAVLLFGPLYHLVERPERLRALREARRVARPGGLVFAAGVSRFASLLDGLRRGRLVDPLFRDIVTRDLLDGQHRNPTGDPAYFTTTFFHHPDELRAEMTDAGLRVERMVGAEGPAWLAAGFDDVWADVTQREFLLDTLRSIEEEPMVVAASAHPVGIGRR
jgi:ubiquinone/menaquinone biosynthesis C-methylase UbiE